MPSPRATAARLHRALGQGHLQVPSGTCEVVEGSESLWEEGQWLPMLMAGLSQRKRKRKTVSTLRMVYFLLHCNRMKYQISVFGGYTDLGRSEVFQEVLFVEACAARRWLSSVFGGNK